MQQAIVAVIVIAAALFAVWRLPGTPTRLRYVAGLKRIGLSAPARWLEKRILRSMAKGGCAACGSGTQQTVHGRQAPRAPR
ncbi:MAG: hypothetical protein ABW136_00275 [Steroidobacteraceae bacterium]